VVGTVAAVASASTGIGALADAGVLGLDAATTATVSTATGLVASAADVPSCVAGDGASCAGAALAGAGGIASGVSNVLETGNAALEASSGSISFGRSILPSLFETKAFGLGLGASAWDISNGLGG
jgi:hypothetical protein